MTSALASPHTTRGIVFVVLATLCFALLDTTTQYVGPLVPVAMAVWLRYLTQTITATALLWPQQGRRLLRMRAPGWHLLRGMLMVASSVAAFICLRYVPVGDFTAILMLVPLLVTLLASLILRERVSPLTWALVAGGMIGAFIVIRPKSNDFQSALLLPLLLVLINALYQIVTSRMVKTEDPGSMHFYTGLTGLICFSALLPWTWEPLARWYLWPLVALLGLFGSVGHYLLIKAFHQAPAARLTPYMYAQIAFATLAGWAVFGQSPDGWTLTGIGLIAVCGVLGMRAR